MDKMTVYNHLPVWGQNAACTMQGALLRRKRYSPYFEKKLEQYKKRGNWSLDRVKVYQDKKLKDLLIHAYRTVPWYKKEFDACGFNPETFQHADELSVLPIITKDVLKEHIDEFISTAELPSKTFTHLTGGTTGKSLPYRTTYNEQSEQWAVWWRYRENLGIKRTDWCGEFGSKLVVPMTQKKAPFYRLDAAEKRLFFSPYHLNAETVRDYTEGLLKTKWIHGYTSKLADMAYRMAEAGITVPMDFVTIGAENLYDSQKILLEKVFGKCVYQHYGLTEGAANISQGIDGVMRVDEDWSYVEFVKEEGASDYSIIGTNFHYYRMPLIRYDTGDYGKLDEGQDGNFRIVKSLHGRDTEYVICPDGTKITAVEFDEEVFAKVNHVAEFQIVQRKYEQRIEIRVIRLNGFERADERILKSRLDEVLNGKLRYSIVYPDLLQKEANRKFKLVISE